MILVIAIKSRIVRIFCEIDPFSQKICVKMTDHPFQFDGKFVKLEESRQNDEKSVKLSTTRVGILFLSILLIHHPG